MYLERGNQRGFAEVPSFCSPAALFERPRSLSDCMAMPRRCRVEQSLSVRIDSGSRDAAEAAHYMTFKATVRRHSRVTEEIGEDDPD